MDFLVEIPYSSEFDYIRHRLEYPKKMWKREKFEYHQHIESVEIIQIHHQKNYIAL